MNQPAVSVTLLASLLVGVPSVVAAAPPTTAKAKAPTSAPAGTGDATVDIKAAYEKGDYKETLRLLARALSLKGKAAEGIDRYELLLIRAEANLHLKSSTQAIQALEEAAKIAPDDTAAAKTRALVTLIKRSRSMQYTPKVAAGGGESAKGPFNLTDLDQREQAFKALYADDKVVARSKVQAAEKAKQLAPIASALKAVVPLKDLETAASGSTAETTDTLNTLTERAHKLMARELDDATKRTEKIATDANELVQEVARSRTGDSVVVTRQRGLNGNDIKELKSIVETCKKIALSCKELSEGFTEDDEPFEDLEDIARDTAERAEEVRTDDYKSAG